MLLFAFAACSAAVPTVSAQESGWWIGGRAGYWHDKVEGVTSSGFALAPEFGHDFNAKWSLAACSDSITGKQGIRATRSS